MATEILMPALSPTMEEGTLAKWLVKEGDTVNSGDILAEIETDKATMEFEAVDEGVIGKLLVAEGTEGVKVNTAIAVLLEEGESASDIAASAPAAAKAPEAAPADAGGEAAPKGGSETPAPPAPVAADGGRIFASPLARRIEMISSGVICMTLTLPQSSTVNPPPDPKPHDLPPRSHIYM